MLKCHFCHFERFFVILFRILEINRMLWAKCGKSMEIDKSMLWFNIQLEVRRRRRSSSSSQTTDNNGLNCHVGCVWAAAIVWCEPQLMYSYSNHLSTMQWLWAWASCEQKYLEVWNGILLFFFCPLNNVVYGNWYNLKSIWIHVWVAPNILDAQTYHRLVDCMAATLVHRQNTVSLWWNSVKKKKNSSWAHRQVPPVCSLTFASSVNRW